MHSDKLRDTQSLLHGDAEESIVVVRAKSNGNQKLHLALLYVVIVFELIAVIVLAKFTRSHDPTLDIYSPASPIIEYEDVVFYDGILEQSPYQKLPPDDVVDELWNRLYRHTLPVKIDRESSKKLPNRTVVAPGSDGEGLIGLEIFHVLHCVNALRKSLWPDRYPENAIFHPNGTRNDFMTNHHNHCVDRVRMNLMCAGNIGTIYWRFNETMSPPKWMVDMETTQKCRNFDKILEWATEREYTGWDDHTPSRLTD